MDALSSDRIVVLSPELAGTAMVDERREDDARDGVSLITGHDTFLYVGRGEGTYRASGRTGSLRPNTLVAVPAGSFACEMTGDHELYVLSVRESPARPADLQTVTPFVEHALSPIEGRRWRDRMAGYVDRARAGRLDFDDVRRVKEDVRGYVWRGGSDAGRDMLEGMLASIWERLDDTLRLDALAAEAGYTANYLNDLSRRHTGRAIGRWITDMRMARARTALEQSDLPVAEVGAACGYDDPAYFSRVFRRAHGVPPATWRIAARPVDARYADVTLNVETLKSVEDARWSEPTFYSYAS